MVALAFLSCVVVAVFLSRQTTQPGPAWALVPLSVRTVHVRYASDLRLRDFHAGSSMMMIGRLIDWRECAMLSNRRSTNAQ